MTQTTRTAPLFRALLKHWRAARGMSQLDLAVNAEISARHLSFLETGRAQPSREMVLKLANTLGLDLRDQNELLAAAGMPAVHPESAIDAPLPPAIERAIERMLKQQEPFPMAVMNRHYDVVRMNEAAGRIFLRFVADPTALGVPVNAYRLAFDPRLMRPFVLDWPRLARSMLSAAQCEALSRPHDDQLRTLIDELLHYPDVPKDWNEPDLSTPFTPTLTVAIARDGMRLEFLTTLTVFNAPRDVTLEELKLESYFPVDPETEAICRQLAT
jgi:transcriptional regulator with XRE-family HTH domain